MQFGFKVTTLLLFCSTWKDRLGWFSDIFLNAGWFEANAPGGGNFWNKVWCGLDWSSLGRIWETCSWCKWLSILALARNYGPWNRENHRSAFFCLLVVRPLWTHLFLRLYYPWSHTQAMREHKAWNFVWELAEFILLTSLIRFWISRPIIHLFLSWIYWPQCHME